MVRLPPPSINSFTSPPMDYFLRLLAVAWQSRGLISLSASRCTLWMGITIRMYDVRTYVCMYVYVCICISKAVVGNMIPWTERPMLHIPIV